MTDTVNTFESIIQQQLPLAELLTKIQFEQDPSLMTRYGKKGWEKCVNDSVYHLLYLAEAVRSENEEIFNAYVEWAGIMLQSRNVPIGVLIDNLHCMSEACETLLADEDYQIITRYIHSSIRRLKCMEPLQETYLTANNPLQVQAKRYLSLLLEGNRTAAMALIAELINSNHSIPSIYENIFAASQYEVGLLWQTNKITVAHEHYCTAATQLIISSIYPNIFQSKKKKAKLVACTVSGDLHEIGIRMLSDLFEMDGWDTYYLGSSMPDENILTALKEQRADVLALSVTIPFHVGKAEALINKIRADKDLVKLKIIVGGYAFHVTNLWKQAGADAIAKNATEAINIANKMIADL